MPRVHANVGVVAGMTIADTIHVELKPSCLPSAGCNVWCRVVEQYVALYLSMLPRLCSLLLLLLLVLLLVQLLAVVQCLVLVLCLLLFHPHPSDCATSHQTKRRPEIQPCKDPSDRVASARFIWIEMPTQGAQSELRSCEIPQRVANSPMPERDAISRCLSEVRVCTMPHRADSDSLAARSQGTAKGVLGGRRGQGWDKGDWVGWGVAANALVTVLFTVLYYHA
jgi:hypothetical protein